MGWGEKWLAGMTGLLAMTSVPAAAQVRTVDPNAVIGATPRAQTQQKSASVYDRAAPSESMQDVTPPAQTNRAATSSDDDAPDLDEQALERARARDQSGQTGPTTTSRAPDTAASVGTKPVPSQTPPAAADKASVDAQTYGRDDLISAAEGVFGKGAQGLAEIIEKVLKDQGRPVGYIAGREASGAFVVGLRYGSGILNHKIEGQQPVYWTGPSVGFDVGGDAEKVFVLVYNLYDSQELFHRFPQIEGRVYFVGGFSASYLRRGDIVLIPVRLGVGWRLGANIGYMKFSKKQKWLPF